MVGLGLPPVGLWLTGGYEPLLVVGNRNDPGHSVTVDGYGSAQVGADLALTPWHAGTRYDFGAIGGYRYNSVLGHGVGLGAVLTIDLGEALALFFSVEYVAFPRASDGLSSAGYPTDRSATWPWLQGGANVGLVVFP